MRVTTAASRTSATSVIRPEHRGHANTSQPKLRSISSAQSQFGLRPTDSLACEQCGESHGVSVSSSDSTGTIARRQAAPRSQQAAVQNKSEARSRHQRRESRQQRHYADDVSSDGQRILAITRRDSSEGLTIVQNGPALSER